MEEKTCPKCKLVKPVSAFNKDKSKSNGYESRCKQCKSKDTREYRQRKKEEIEIEEVQEKECNLCHKTLPSVEFHKNCYSDDGLKSMCKKCYSSTRKKTKEVSKAYDYTSYTTKKTCTDCFLEKDISMFRRNRKSTDNYSHICLDCLPKSNHTKEKQRIYEKKYAEKPEIKMYRTLRNSQNRRIREQLKMIGQTKNKRTIEYLGCSIEYLKAWFDFQLSRKSMTWDTYGQWEIDHVRPCKSFDFTKQEDLHKCFHWTNLQPLTRKENIQKFNHILPDVIENHAKLVEEFQQSFSAENKEGELRETPKGTSTNLGWRHTKGLS